MFQSHSGIFVPRKRSTDMDIFSTAVTAGQIILTYLDACSSYSKEAKSLYHRFKWDLRVLEEILAYFEKLKSQHGQHNSPPLPEDDNTLLNETGRYLADLISEVSCSLAKLQVSGHVRKTISKSLWITRRSGLKDLEKELHEWTTRFDIRLLGLPHELKSIIPPETVTLDDGAPSMGLVESNTRMHHLKTLTIESKKQKINQLLCDPPYQLLQEIEETPDRVRPVFQLDSRPVILSSRPFPPDVYPETEEFHKLTSDLGELAAALHILDSNADVSLLKVEYFFYNVPSRQFYFVQSPPSQIDEVLTLEEMIVRAPYSHILSKNKAWLPLNQRFTLAKRLAEAVFFLHTAGFVHKNITPTSIICLQRSSADDSARFPSSIGDPYISGFDLIRSNDGLSDLGAALNLSSSNRHLNQRNAFVFQHPDRLQPEGGKLKRYTKNHDIYSLGVVLLQIGLWEPINMITRRLEDDCAGWPKALSEVSKSLGLKVGVRYQEAVLWCLKLNTEPLVTDAEFAQEVLGPLEIMAKAVS
ncbi:uncharacterized protein F4812DRAFT_421633 [Daldinia caldariorum]|uniref:uncharacterized protein n=1 Tax=Daldinia caldariorum TaxID=326644 RepID=UPI002007497D|nr:uncharacterized protein F4812DRAFT_421633 [Daldinia caldariorum]KAI1470141.1 hypothetical protein F4812DRAFT_421633 [Daldinia caldariorum]